MALNDFLMICKFHIWHQSASKSVDFGTYILLILVILTGNIDVCIDII